jgi:hypothetical protein
VKLCRAEFLAIRGVPDVTWNLARTAAGTAVEVGVVTGGPASGKTRLLEAILAAKEIIAPYSLPVDGRLWLRPGESAAKIELTFTLDLEEQRRAGGAPAMVHAEALFTPSGCHADVDDAFASILDRYEHGPDLGKVDYYAANRGIAPTGPMHGTSAIEQRTYRLGRDARKYSFIPRLLRELDADPERRAWFSKTLTALCPWLTYAPSSVGDGQRCFSGRSGAPASATELSTTESEAVLFAGTAAMVHLDRSIVLIDRPEQSAGERSIAAWVAAARQLGDDMQLILATSSPALLASVDPAAVLDLGG